MDGAEGIEPSMLLSKSRDLPLVDAPEEIE
jgi:hypothetical protein